MSSFRGTTYECVLDLLRLKTVTKAQLEAFKQEKTFARLLKDKERIKDVDIKIIETDKFIKELQKIIDDTMKEISEINSEMEDLEFALFVSFFVYGDRPEKIMKEFAIAKTTYYKYMQRIQDRIYRSQKGEERNLGKLLELESVTEEESE